MLASLPLPTLSADQQEALRTLIEHDGNCFLTGLAGTGKSTIIRALLDRVPLMLTATTGAAALNIGGCTVDTLFSINRDTWEYRNPDKAFKNLNGCPRIIVIDEASMIGGNMAKLIARAAKDFGKKLIMVGDLGQASPVKDSPLVHTELFKTAKFIRLTEVHRQKDPELLQALNSVRRGEVTPLVRQVFGARVAVSVPEDDSWVRLYATNTLTKTYNNNRLSLINYPPVYVESTYVDLRDSQMQARFPLYPERTKQLLEECRLAHQLDFKVGARVLLTRNVYLDPEAELGDPDNVLFVTGDAGVIEEIIDQYGALYVPEVQDVTSDSFWDDTPAPEPVPAPTGDAPVLAPLEKPYPRTFVVRLDRTKEIVNVGEIRHDHVDLTFRKDPIGSIYGFPMTLGWAVTIHKCQGQTLHRAYVDMNSIMSHPRSSRHGLAYVALSRTRTPEGLLLSGWNDGAVYVDEAVRPFL